MPVTYFPEKITKFLRRRLVELKEECGEDSWQYRGIALQYIRDTREDINAPEENIKHYEAGVIAGELPPGLERLYRRSLVIEPTLVCVAHCRYCLRSNYAKHTLSEQQLVDVACYCGSGANRDYLNEVLITGGDPLLIPNRIEFLLNALIEHAPNIRIVRLATRIPTQDPDRIDQDALRVFQNKPSLRFEMATQINSPAEFCPETEDAFRRARALGVRIYSQNVLLKGVNDDPAVLVDLYDRMRLNDIEAHYLFHSVPMRGTHHLRTSVDRGLKLANGLTSCGRISGRAKPMFAAMTDIGKITFYQGTIVDRRDGKLLLQSEYRLEDRLAWNPSWELPESAQVDSEGRLQVWYLDGAD